MTSSMPPIIIIIGAPRSGTNMLRNVLTQLPGFGTWPCDEINYIWRHGNIHEPTDEFPPELATKQIQQFIHRAFIKLANKQKCSFLVEKTCANSLRVGFVNRILPEARFIRIIRDGRDAVASARQCWTAPLNVAYIIRKARFVPLSDFPYHASRYLWNRFFRLISPERRLAFWGPRFKGMEEMLHSLSLAEVCALQWARCVNKSEHELGLLDPNRVYRLKYEVFVTNPSGELQKLAKFLDIPFQEEDVYQLIQNISSQRMGTWKKSLDQKDLAKIKPLIKMPMERYGYI